MPHTYASVEDLKRYIIDGGDASWDESDAHLLTLLEGSSRRVDGWTMRSDFGSGFGPRIGTNRYDHDGSDLLLLGDDLWGASDVSVTEGTGGGTVTLTADTDYFLRPYGGPPYTELVFNGLGEAPRSGLRVLSLTGTFGYALETVAAGSVALASTTATSAIVTGATVYAGQTLLVGSEQVYVTTGGGTATVVRGVNGTTAAAGTAAAVAYKYPREVVVCTLQLAVRRHRASQAGLTGDFGGGNLPTTTQRDTEWSILKGNLSHLKRYAAG